MPRPQVLAIRAKPLPRDSSQGAVSVRIRTNHDVKDQFFTLAGGTATEWLFHRYDYVRRS